MGTAGCVGGEAAEDGNDVVSGAWSRVVQQRRDRTRRDGQAPGAAADVDAGARKVRTQTRARSRMLDSKTRIRTAVVGIVFKCS